MPSTESRPQVAVIGAARHDSHEDRTRSLPELIFGCVREALDDAECEMSDVSGIVIAAHDLIDGRSLSSMITGPAAGAYLRDEIRVSDDALTAVSIAVARIEAGEADTVVVASWGRPSEGDPMRSSRASFDPFTEQPFQISELTVSALRASAYVSTYSALGSARDSAAAARTTRVRASGASELPGNGSLPPFPLMRGEVSPQHDVVAAIVLRRGGSGPLIAGVGHGSARMRMGDQSLLVFEGAADATRRALADAGRGLGDVDLAEISGGTMFDEAVLIESVGLAEPGGGLAAYAEHGWINPSGGSATGDCYPASGLLRLIDAVRQLTGRGGESQIAPTPSLGLVAANAAVGGQTTTTVMVERR